jgi:hypothetical protein
MEINNGMMRQKRWLSVTVRAFEVWLVIALGESLHGFARVTLLAPLVGDFRARQFAVFSGALITVSIAYLFRDRIVAGSIAELIVVGAFWVGFTIAFEIGLGLLVLGLSRERVFSDYDVVNGGLMPVGLLVMLFAPMIASRSVKSSR